MPLSPLHVIKANRNFAWTFHSIDGLSYRMALAKAVHRKT